MPSAKSQLKSAKTSKRAGPKLGPMRLPDLYTAPGHLIRRSQQIAVAIFLDEFEKWQLTPVQYAALIAIRESPGIEQRTLVDQIAIDRSTIGAMLRTLERRHLIRRKTPSHNLRVKQLFIQEAGEQIMDETRMAIYRVQERILAPLTQAERKTFTSLISKVVQLNNNQSRAPLRLSTSSPAPAES